MGGASGVGDEGGIGVSVAETIGFEAGVRVGTIGSGVMVGTTLVAEQPAAANITNSSVPATSDEKRRIQSA